VIERNGKKFYLHHGDGLGPGDNKYKFLKKIFRSKLCQWLFARLHPNLGIGIANAWSHNSKLVNAKIGEEKLHPKEWIEIYSNDVLQTLYFDYMVYGHRHKPMDVQLTGKSRYINLGDWVSYFTYAVFDGNTLELKYFKEPEAEAAPK
jgi:UDP-2,3-diacylglucosamine hydrolase